jgi:thiamine pyrophosphate-dependent acetolactate synthase large subunit-like protein
VRSLEAAQILHERLGDALVVTSLGTPSYLMHAAGDRGRSFYMWGAMGMASSAGLGLAIARPNERVVVVDGDGAAVMNLGGMVTVGARSPKNLLWVILENGVFLETGGQPIATHGSADLVEIAKGAGIPRAARAETPDDLGALLDQAFTEPGPTLIVARVERDTVREFPPVDPVGVRLRFMDAIGRKPDARFVGFRAYSRPPGLAEPMTTKFA